MVPWILGPQGSSGFCLVHENDASQGLWQTMQQRHRGEALGSLFPDALAASFLVQHARVHVPTPNRRQVGAAWNRSCGVQRFFSKGSFSSIISNSPEPSLSVINIIVF